jgi:hypothetical protein
VTPIILGISFILSVVTLIKEGYGGYPAWATIVGVVIAIGIVILSFVLMSIRGKTVTTGVSKGD